MKADVYNKEGKKMKSNVELDKKIFLIKPNEHSIYLVVKSELSAKRQGTSKAKTRSEVRGSGAKPWKQKGTGRARVGSSRNPSRVHGGSAFGPEPRNYKSKINKKVKLLAKRSALSIKIKENLFKIVDDLNLKSLKTKDFVKILENLKINNTKLTLITGNPDKNIYLSSRNLNYINFISAKNMSTYDIVNSDMLLFDKTSIEVLNESLK